MKTLDQVYAQSFCRLALVHSNFHTGTERVHQLRCGSYLHHIAAWTKKLKAVGLKAAQTVHVNNSIVLTLALRSCVFQQQQQRVQAASATESNNIATCVLLWVASEDWQGMANFPNVGGTQQQTC